LYLGVVVMMLYKTAEVISPPLSLLLRLRFRSERSDG